MWYYLAKLYSYFYCIGQDYFGTNLRGMGFLTKRIKSERILTVDGLQMYFHPRAATCYLRNLSGQYNEPETHAFLRSIITSLQTSVSVVDVGANIGEMVLDVARYPNIERVIGFEPNPFCADACRRSSALNKYTNITIIQKAVDDKGGSAVLYVNNRAPVTSSLLASEERQPETIEATTLDRELAGMNGPAIFIIDVEGAEKLVMQGGKNFIRNRTPLIIFEYNELTRRFCTLDDISEILGEGYTIYRLRREGTLDTDLSETWNCVAVHRASPMHALCQNVLMKH